MEQHHYMLKALQVDRNKNGSISCIESTNPNIDLTRR